MKKFIREQQSFKEKNTPNFMKSVLLVGGAGIIGKHIAEGLARDYKIVIFDRNKNTPYETIQFDVLNKKKFSEEFKKYEFDAVIHLISSNSIPNAEKNFREAFSRDVESLRNLLSCCNPKTKIIFTSSTVVYGNQPIPHSENLLPKPENIYGMLKYLCEEILIKNCLEKGIPYTILRFSGIYSPGNDRILIEKLFKAAESGEKLNLCNLNQIRDYLSIEDAITIFKKTINLPESDNQIINASDGKSYMLKDIVDLFEDFKERFNFLEGETGYDSVSDITKLKKIYGITPSFDIKKDIIKRIKKIKKN